MSVIQEKYQVLPLSGESLSDVVVLAQAWKKSHTFIRRHNWYADVLELDSSTVDLEQRLSQWKVDIQNPSFSPDALSLVPAPKNGKWHFKQAPELSSEALLDVSLDEPGFEPSFDDWRPIPAKSELADDISAAEQKLRPLAHVSIRDQTLATAVMMCLAEVVETAQGDPSERDVSTARERGIVSYGNRLQCRWMDKPNGAKRAQFSWGNSRTYRQYFEDYRAFLARPRKVCAEMSSRLAPRRELFVVALDIKSFFDCIDSAALLGELRRLEAAFNLKEGVAPQFSSDDAFWSRASRIFDWKWRAADQQYAPYVHNANAERLRLGLPQGLVASGFFANAYLVGFDEALRSDCEKGRKIGPETRVRDYCRYVDDIRIVVEAPASSGTISSDLTLWLVKELVNKQLRDHCERLGTHEMLVLSETKCSITPYRSMSSQSNMSALMEVLNAELSGTFDLESLTQTAGGLEGLLWMSDQIEDDTAPKPSRLSLASIAVPNTDVRDDTVKRFVATRLAQLMRYRLAMTDSAAPVDDDLAVAEEVRSGIALSHEFEQTARKLIKCWGNNPSLALLLRCGLDLFPHPKLLAPVVEALSSKLPFKPVAETIDSVKQILTAQYVVADLFRAGAVETGYRDADDYPENVDILGYREDLGAFARRVILELPNSPWYLLQQAYLYLSSIGDTALVSIPQSDEQLRGYVSLQRAMLFEPTFSADLLHALPFSLVSQQLRPNPRRFGVWLTECLSRTESENLQASVVMTVSLNRPDLILEALASRAVKTTHWKRFVPSALLERNRKSFKRGRGSGKERPLTRCMFDAENVFGQENGLLALTRALLRVSGIQDRLTHGLSANEIIVRCQDWTVIQALSDTAGSLSVELLPFSGPPSPLYENPLWVREEKAWLYGLGRILRAALTGEFDFTSRRYLVTEDIGRYTGLRSTWFKRRFGMLNTGRGLLDEPAPLSPWLSGLLSTLLQWPGVEFNANGSAGAADANTPEELLLLVEKRIKEQQALFGSRSGTPIYVVPVADNDGPLADRPLRIAVVQPLRPRRNDFDVKDPTHWTPRILKEHRRHLAEVCRLAHQQLRAWASAQPLSDIDTKMPIVDVVLFPELSVHPEHVGTLRRLSDKLHANIFAGLTFIDSPKVGGPINQGLWLLRTETPGHGRSIEFVWQGKLHPMKLERDMGVKPYRPHLTLVELPVGTKSPTRIAAAICYDATDLDLVADLRSKSDVFLVAALNQDVQTFDNMVAALHFHMYQPVILANSGEFGGSTAQVPLPKHERMVSHVHGNNQIAVSVFEVDPAPFKSTATLKPTKELKTAPAGYKGRPSS